jgi:hypothetical protein
VYPALILVVIVFITVRPISDPDCWFHMAHGRHFLEHGEVLKRDIFSHTAAGREWISSGWLASVIMQTVFARWGPNGLILLVTALVAAVYGTFYVAALRRKAPAELAALIALVSLLAAYMRFNPRPDIFSLVVLPVFVLLLLRLHAVGQNHWRRWATLALIPAAMMLWANLHAGFLAGLLVLWIALSSAWLAGRKTLPRQRLAELALSGAAASVAWLLNPYGWQIVELAAKIRAIPGVGMLIFEWMPLVYLPGFNLPWPTYAGLAGLAALGVWLWRRAPGGRAAWPWIASAVLALFALAQRRQAGLFAVGLPFLMLPALPSLARLAARSRLMLSAAVVALGVAICGLQYKGTLEMGEGWPEMGVNARMLPCFPTEFLDRTAVPQKLFNSYGMGGYLLYHLGTRLPVFIDGRLDVYDPKVWADYLAADENRMPLAALRAAYGVNTCAIETRDAFGDPVHLANRLTQDPEWALVFFDDDYAIFCHRAETPPETLAHELRYANPFAPERFVAALRSGEAQRRALEELQYAIATSQGCANAYALAALAAQMNGEMDAAARYRATAAARNPGCPLLRWAPPAAGTAN